MSNHESILNIVKDLPVWFASLKGSFSMLLSMLKKAPISHINASLAAQYVAVYKNGLYYEVYGTDSFEDFEKFLMAGHKLKMVLHLSQFEMYEE